MRPTNDLHVQANQPLIAPAELAQALPLSDNASEVVANARDAIRSIMHGHDHRVLVVVGPCSIHDVKAAHEYGTKLFNLRQELAGQLEIVMRVYFEKPRTTTGWKGLINDPHLNGSYDMNAGLHMARQLLITLAEMGMPAATELLDPITPQYIADTISWTAIGARPFEIVPGAGTTDDQFKKATEFLDQIMNSVEKYSCDWLDLKFELSYAFYVWGQQDSRHLKSARTHLGPLEQDYGAGFRDVAGACDGDEARGEALRRRLVWLKEKVQ
jgi:hypothetical protein